jgi:ABC-2 type transport system ATP-binding protein
MAKRVQLAQALIGDPEVVLLDEPTAGLDPRVAYEVRQLIKSRKGRCTLIVSSHNLQELEEICDGAAILDRGRVVASGSMSELTASSEEIRIKLSPGPSPIPLIRDLPMVKRVEWDDERRELVVASTPSRSSEPCSGSFSRTRPASPPSRRAVASSSA